MRKIRKLRQFLRLRDFTLTTHNYAEMRKIRKLRQIPQFLHYLQHTADL